MRRTTPYAQGLRLGADTDLTLMPAIELGDDGYLALQVIIDDGSGGAPTDAPVGTWELHCSADGPGGRYSPVLGVGTVLSDQLALIAAKGNVAVSAWAMLYGVPGAAAKLRYKRGSGGASSAKATILAVTTQPH